MRVTFFCVAKIKSPKKRRPHCLRPFASLRATCGARGRGASQNSLRCFAAPFKQLRRANPRSLCVLRHTGHPAHCAPRRIQRGWGANSPSGRRCARPSLRSAWRLRPRDGAERSNGPCGCPAVRLSTPLLAAPAAGRLRGEHGRQCAHASLSSSPWLSERSAQREVSSTAHPATDPTQVAPQRSEGVADWGSPFFWVLFFGEAKNKYLACRGDSRPPPSAKARGNISAQASTSSARTDGG